MLQELCFSSFSSTSSSSSSTSLSTLLLFSAGSSLLTVAFPDSMLMKFSLLIVFNTWKSVIEVFMLSSLSEKIRFEETESSPSPVSWNCLQPVSVGFSYLSVALWLHWTIVQLPWRCETNFSGKNLRWKKMKVTWWRSWSVSFQHFSAGGWAYSWNSTFLIVIFLIYLH